MLFINDYISPVGKILLYASNNGLKGLYFYNQKYFPNISLFFDDYEFIISYPDLFERIYNSCIFIVKYDSTLSSDYTIGLNFIYHYLTKFDYEDNTISFYSDTHEIIRHSTRDEIIYPVFVLYFIISLILVSGVFYLSLYKYFTNKKENSNTINI